VFLSSFENSNWDFYGCFRCYENLEEASIANVVCVDEKRAEQAYGERSKNLFCIQDKAAIENILLTAASLGLGSRWIGAFKEAEIRKVINAPRI